MTMEIARTNQKTLTDGSITFDVVVDTCNHPKPVTFVCDCESVADKLASHINDLYDAGHIVEIVIE